MSSDSALYCLSLLSGAQAVIGRMLLSSCFLFALQLKNNVWLHVASVLFMYDKIVAIQPGLVRLM